MTEEKIVKLNIDSLTPNPYQPRKNFNENSIKELALSIREYGVLNPILVRQKDDKYEIVAGERRTRAAKLLNLTEIPAIIKDIDDEKMAEIALIENLQRENLTPIEEAMTYQEILKNTNKTEKELSEMIGKSQPFIANKLRLLNLPDDVKDALINKRISERHTRSLLTVKDENRQLELLDKIIAEKLTVKELDSIINEEINNEDKKEEKESDNMNNGSFFPNFNNGADANNQASLNSMNAQATGGFTYQPEAPAEPAAQPAVPPVVEQMPTMPEVNTFSQVENGANVVPTAVSANPMVTPEAPVPTTDFSQPSPLSTPEVGGMSVAPEPPVIEEPAPMADIPLFNAPEFNQPIEPPVANPMPTEPMPQPAAPIPEPTSVEPLIQPAAPVEPMAPVAETPLFNPEAAAPMPEPPVTAEQNAFEVPVAAEPGPAGDKYTQVTELLNSNGVEYKSYNSETGHCIIIEL